VRRNPLLYSDQTEIEELNTIEPIEKKRSFAFFFIVLANSILVLLVLLAIWLFLSKSPDTSFDQQLKIWTQQFFSQPNDDELKTAATPPKTQQASVNLELEEKRLELERIEQENAQKEAILKAEQAKLEALATKLQEEKDNVETIQETVNKTNPTALTEEVDVKPIESNSVEEAAIVPNAAKDIPDQPANTAQTQLEKILETMQTQE